MFSCVLRAMPIFKYSRISTRAFRRALIASVDRRGKIWSAECPFSGVTNNYGRVWRKDAGKRGLECGFDAMLLSRSLHPNLSHILRRAPTA